MPCKRILIVGGVAGGASCAARLRRLDENAEIFVFERGGDVSFANCGLPYYLGGVIADRRQLFVATPERFRDFFNVEVRTWHEVRRIDRAGRTVEVQNRQTGAVANEPYDVLVLSTGAAPVRPPLPGVDLPGVFTLRDLDDTDQIHKWIDHRKPNRAVVVGAGYIGLEMAENLSRRGIAVTLLELADQVMPPADPEMVVPLQQELERQGVDLRLGNAVAALRTGAERHDCRGGQKWRAVRRRDGDSGRRRRPDTRLAREAGLEIGPTGGIRVDDQMRTSDPRIFAVGDAVEVREFLSGLPALIPLAGPANRQGRVAADVICGRDAHYRGSQGTAVVGLFDLTFAMTGTTEKVAAKGRHPLREVVHPRLPSRLVLSRRRADHAEAALLARDGPRAGAQAVGRAGVEKRIDVIAMAIQMKATVFDLEEAELCYAPQYGSAKDPVNMAGFVAANILRGDVAVSHWSEWKRRQAAGQTPVTLDVRPPTAVAANAIPGTIRIPMGELRAPARRIAPRPRDLGPLWRRPNVLLRRPPVGATWLQGPQPLGRDDVYIEMPKKRGVFRELVPSPSGRGLG